MVSSSVRRTASATCVKSTWWNGTRGVDGARQGSTRAASEVQHKVQPSISEQMTTLEERVCGLEDRVVVMCRLMMGMARDIEALRGEELGYEGQGTMAVTDVMLPTQEATAEADGVSADGGQHGRVAAKQSQSKSSNPQRIPLFPFTVVQSSASDVVATKLDARQLLEAEIRKATQETAQGQAEGRFVIRNGHRHPINKCNGFVSDWPMGQSGCFLCRDDYRFEHCSRWNEQGGKARFHANFGVHRPEHTKQVKLMAELTDCGKRIH
eukprot:scaffold101563_cov34-Attheya_sp.AAC.2